MFADSRLRHLGTSENEVMTTWIKYNYVIFNFLLSTKDVMFKSRPFLHWTLENRFKKRRR